MNHKQYEELDRNDLDVQKRLQNISEKDIVSTKKEFEDLQKKYPEIPDWMWPQNRSEALDYSHVEDIRKDMDNRFSTGNPMPQKTPISVYDIREMFDIAAEDPSLIGFDGGHRLEAIRQLGWQRVGAYVADVPKNAFKSGNAQVMANLHGQISKSNTFETLLAKLNEWMDDVRTKKLTKKDCEESETLIGKLVYTFEKHMRGKDDKKRRKAKKAMKNALIEEWGMHKEDAADLLGKCIEYENSQVSYNGETSHNLDAIGATKAYKNIGYRLNDKGEVKEIIASTLYGTHIRAAFHTLEDIDMEGEGFLKIGNTKLALASNVIFSFVLGCTFRQKHVGRNPASVVTKERSSFMHIINKKLAYRGKALKIKIGNVYFTDQIKHKESGILKLSTNNKGLFPAIKKGIYDSKNLENSKIAYKGW